MGESIVVRLLSRIGVALAALMFAGAVFAQTPPLTAPVYKTPAGHPAAAFGMMCLNLDGTICTFGGGGTLSVNASANPTVITPGSGRSLNEGLFSNLFVTLVNNADGSLPDFTPGANGIVVIGGPPPANGGYMAVTASGLGAGVIGCDKSATYDASTSGDTQIVAASGSTTIYVCGYTMFTPGTVNVNLDSADTGGACANPVKITPAFQLTAQSGAVDGSPFYRGLKTPAGKALCWKASAAVAGQGIVYYTQF